jgi:hypothetical protein
VDRWRLLIYQSTSALLTREACELNMGSPDAYTVRTTLDIPEPLHERLRHRPERSGTPLRALVIRAREQVFSESGEASHVTGPPVTARAKLGPDPPKDENTHDLVFFSSESLIIIYALTNKSGERLKLQPQALLSSSDRVILMQQSRQQSQSCQPSDSH